MSEQYIEVVISNLEIKDHTSSGMMAYIMMRLEYAGVPVNGWFQNKGYTVSTGHLEYTRNAMSQSSVYIWKSDDYIKKSP